MRSYSRERLRLGERRYRAGSMSPADRAAAASSGLGEDCHSRGLVV